MYNEEDKEFFMKYRYILLKNIALELTHIHKDDLSKAEKNIIKHLQELKFPIVYSEKEEVYYIQKNKFDKCLPW